MARREKVKFKQQDKKIFLKNIRFWSVDFRADESTEHH